MERERERERDERERERERVKGICADEMMTVMKTIRL